MLTQSEKKWLKARRLRQAKHHIYHRNEYFIWSGYHFAKDEIADLKDALEFSERVAVKLADAYWPPLVYTPVAPFEQLFMPPMDRLKWARIEVEEEMDNGA